MSPPAANDSDAPAAAAAVVPVLLPLPLGGAYSYAWPEERLGTAPEPGRLVRVPLGRRSLVGAVWDGEVDPVPAERLRAVEGIVPLPPLPPALRRLVDWVAAYVMAPPGAVLRMVLASPGALEPEPLRQGVRLAAGGTGTGALRPTAARGRVLTVAADGLARAPVDLARESGVSPSVVAGLIEAGALERVAWSEGRDFPAFTDLPSGPVLSPDQQAVADDLRGSVGAGFAVSLIDGVTGSGKTEVYFEAIAAALRRGRQCLVLLPEIALSAQWLERFEARFGEAPAQWHSDLGPKQRRRTWRAVAEGRVRVLVGARSALFLPFPDLGLIVVDEEHDGAFKQEEGTVYQARDMAVVRGQLEAVPVVLASATPSIETLVNCRLHRYRRLHLPERHGGATLPRVELVDLRRDPPPALAPREPGWLSPPLREAVRATLDAGEQALLFLNRRGFAPLTLCRTCGHRFQCPNCTAWLVEHRLAGRLQCHHCGIAMPLPKSCPGCGDTDSLVPCGPGVERLAAEAATLFPEARRILLSSDSLRGPLAAAALLEQVRTREVDLLIGTQVVAKGHHFPWLTLVGVVDADLGLEGGDLRAAERTFQLLSQVAGRAGREDRPGRVLLQTRSPDHPVLLALAEGDREGFIEAEIDARRRGFLPPFARLAAIIVSAESAGAADGLAAALGRCAPRARELIVLGPAPAPLAILRGRHRRRFLVKAPRSWPLQRTLSDWLSQVAVRGSARVSVDIDPYSFL